MYTQSAERRRASQPSGGNCRTNSNPPEPPPLSGGRGRPLQRAAAATVVADDANRIIFVNEAAGELLWWTPEALVGQRLTVLIPPGAAGGPLAGFSRLQVMGEPRILGSTLHVPALRRDGSSIEVALIIDQLAARGGRRAFPAVLAPTDEGSEDCSPGSSSGAAQ